MIKRIREGLMAYDEKTAERVRVLLSGRKNVTEQPLMGGICFMVNGNMCCAVSGRGGLLVRVGPDAHAQMVREPHSGPMEMGSRIMKGYVRVAPEGYRTEGMLKKWLTRGVATATWSTAPSKITNPQFPIHGLNKLVERTPPVVAKNTREAAVFGLNWLSATGSGIFIAAIFSGFIMGFGAGEIFKIYLRTIVRVRFSLLTISAMMAIGFLARYGGLDATMGLAFARTGHFYPFFGTLLGWLGVALTGSDTASNVLFGSLQKISAQQVGVSPVLMSAANSCGGVMGKMIDAQSIVVASTATEWYGHEGDILRYVFFHSIALACLVGILVFLMAYVSSVYTHGCAVRKRLWSRCTSSASRAKVRANCQLE